MKKTLFALSIFLVSSLHAAPSMEYYKLIVYHFSSNEQEKKLDNFIANQFIPALHLKGFKQVGVFKPIANDTANDKQIVLLINGANLNRLIEPIQWNIKEGTAFNEPLYKRYEQILLRAFKDMPLMKIPTDASKKVERIYELRNYESPTEEKYLNKVHMFNEGGEIKLFNELQFNAVFYADVLFGSTMPNLMYMTSFDNIDSRNEHWKAFGASKTWKELVAMPFYQNNMSALYSQLMQSTPYSDY